MAAEITINGTSYNVYVAIADIDAYANGMIGPAGAAWLALTDDDKARCDVTATRWIDGECWRGEKSDPAQPLAWPRTIGDIAVIEQACIVLSIMLAADPELYDRLSGATVQADGGTKRLKAGSVEIEYFRKIMFTIGADGDTVSAFPLNVMNLVAQWLCDSGPGSVSPIADAGSTAFDTDKRTNYYKGKFGFWEPI